MTRPRPTPEMLRRLLRYDPDTGLLFWRARPVEMFNDGGGKYTAIRNQKIWNTKNAGKEAFTYLADGYRTGMIFGKPYRAHRVIWCMATGAWPVDQIDHEDHDRSNNRLGNLRAATNDENQKNQKFRSNNTSGVCGVHWCSTHTKWKAQICSEGKRESLGYFHDKAAAIAARAAAEIKYNFHPNHGRK